MEKVTEYPIFIQMPNDPDRAVRSKVTAIRFTTPAAIAKMVGVEKEHLVDAKFVGGRNPHWRVVTIQMPVGAEAEESLEPVAFVSPPERQPRGNVIFSVNAKTARDMIDFMAQQFRNREQELVNRLASYEKHGRGIRKSDIDRAKWELGVYRQEAEHLEELFTQEELDRARSRETA